MTESRIQQWGKSARGGGGREGRGKTRSLPETLGRFKGGRSVAGLLRSVPLGTHGLILLSRRFTRKHLLRVESKNLSPIGIRRWSIFQNVRRILQEGRKEIFLN